MLPIAIQGWTIYENFIKEYEVEFDNMVNTDLLRIETKPGHLLDERYHNDHGGWKK